MSTTFAVRPLDVTPVDHGVSVRWFAAGVDANAALRDHVAAVAGVEPGSVEVGRLCGHCGSADHGRPWASHGVHVSLARAGDHLVTAVSTAGPVGVDVEAVSEVDRAWDDVSSLLEPHGVIEGSGRAALWCSTEAALKRQGTGFRPIRSDAVPEPTGYVDDLVAPAGFCAAVAYADPAQPA
jgi:4'-phosphopantetheinyl transferase